MQYLKLNQILRLPAKIPTVSLINTKQKHFEYLDFWRAN